MLIYLIGMMGSGKTTIGKQLSEKLSYNFIDTDNQIEFTKCKKIGEIINDFGIEKFREYEFNELQKTKFKLNTIISTGGGIVLSIENREFMKKNGVVIYLKTSIDVLEERLTKTNLFNRPLLKSNNIYDIYRERQTLYEEAADITILCDNLSVEEICLNIKKKIFLAV